MDSRACGEYPGAVAGPSPRPRRRALRGSSTARLEDPVPSEPAGWTIPTSQHTRSTPAGADRLALVIATGAGAGLFPVAPGTAGSAVGVLVYLPLSFLSLEAYAIAVGLVILVGIWAADRAERHYREKDDGRIVIDEIAGQLVTLAPLVALAPDARSRAPLLLFGGFLVFRAFDIWKPRPARWAEERLPGGAGVVMDDVVAGALGLLLMIPVALGARA